MSDLVTMSQMETTMESLMKAMAKVEDSEHMGSNTGKQIAACSGRVSKPSGRTDRFEAELSDIRIETEEMKRDITRELRHSRGSAGR